MPLQRDSKLGYGYLLVGATVPYLVDKLFGPIAALAITAILLVVGIAFLLSAHHERLPIRGLSMTIWIFTLYGAGLGGLGGGLLGAIIHLRTNGKVTAEAKGEATPHPTKLIENSHLGMSLIMDKSSRDDIHFHLVLESIGQSQISVGGLTIKNKAVTLAEGALAPARKIIPGAPVVYNSSIPRKEIPASVTVAATYEVNQGSVPFTVKYEFLIRLIDLKPGTTLLPISRDEASGDSSMSSQLISESLKQPNGSFQFWFREKQPDGGPTNLHTSAGPNREIFFDPSSRTIHLVIDSQRGIIHRQRELLEGKGGWHYVAVTWNEAGDIHLYVDGRE